MSTVYDADRSAPKRMKKISAGFSVVKLSIFAFIFFAAGTLSAGELLKAFDGYYYAVLGGSHKADTEEDVQKYNTVTKLLNAEVGKGNADAKNLIKKLGILKSKEAQGNFTKKEREIIHSACSQKMCIFMECFNPGQPTSHSYRDGRSISFYSISKQLEPKLFTGWSDPKTEKKRSALWKKMGKYQQELKEFTAEYRKLRKEFAALDRASQGNSNSGSATDDNEMAVKIDRLTEQTEALTAEIKNILKSITEQDELKDLPVEDQKKILRSLSNLQQAFIVQDLRVPSSRGGGYFYTSSSGINYAIERIVRYHRDRLNNEEDGAENAE